MESCDTLLLLCDEKLFHSPPPSSPSTDSQNRQHFNPNSVLFDNYSRRNQEENRLVLQNYLKREGVFTPMNGYWDKLRDSSGLSAARYRAVRLILMARRRLKLEDGTVFAAVNYLDRFISLNCHILKWEVWMIELISIACLSIASKVDEVFIPSLNDIQIENLEHTYQSSTIQRMELAILKALDWRLICVTPYSYVDLLINHFASPPRASLFTHTVELLLRALLDSKFVGYSASAIAVSALRWSVEELIPLESEAYLSVLEQLMPSKLEVEIFKCHILMEEQRAKPHCCPMSPVTVIPLAVQRTEVFDSCVDIDTCFLCCRKDFNLKKKRKHEGFGSTSSK